MEWDAFQEAIRDQYTEEELENLHNEIHRERVLIAFPEMQMKAECIVNEVKSHIDEDELISVTVRNFPHVSNSLHVTITCNEIAFSGKTIEEFCNTMKNDIVDGVTFGGGKELDTIKIEFLIKNFYHELK